MDPIPWAFIDAVQYKDGWPLVAFLGLITAGVIVIGLVSMSEDDDKDEQ